jgi:excisionase family DNA binding protein
MYLRQQRKMLATGEAAGYLGLGKSTLDKARLTGKGPRFIKFGRRVLYDPNDLEAWLDAHRTRVLPPRSFAESRKVDDGSHMWRRFDPRQPTLAILRLKLAT